MEKILECLTDPSWWLTAVVVAFFMSLFAAIVHRPLLRLIATRSARVRAWQLEQDRRLDEQVDEIMKDLTRIIVTYLELIKVLIMQGIMAAGGVCQCFIAFRIGRLLSIPWLVSGLLLLVYSGFLLCKYVAPLWALTERISARLNAKGKDAP